MTESAQVSPKKRSPRENRAIREFILRNLETRGENIVALATKEFGISRTAANGYLRRLANDGLIAGEGKTKARRYALIPIKETRFEIELTIGLAEHHIFRFRILPLMAGLPQNVIDICQYGFTEMLNNAIDHSASATATIVYEQTFSVITMWVIDEGIGIFNKIQQYFGLADPRAALLELSKGKLTSDRTRHSGEGIFYTSRMFEKFMILSSELNYLRERRADDDWLIETHDSDKTVGTAIWMAIPTDANWTTRQVFDKYQLDDLSFRKTHVPLRLGKYPGEQLVSRSQAKRILARFEQFSEVMLDFSDVPDIGQAFADEIFRVFANAHPGTKIVPVQAGPRVLKMIAYVKASATEPRDGS